jgi:hypothetical protein
MNDRDNTGEAKLPEENPLTDLGYLSETDYTYIIASSDPDRQVREKEDKKKLAEQWKAYLNYAARALDQARAEDGPDSTCKQAEVITALQQNALNPIKRLEANIRVRKKSIAAFFTVSSVFLAAAITGVALTAAGIIGFIGILAIGIFILGMLGIVLAGYGIAESKKICRLRHEGTLHRKIKRVYSQQRKNRRTRQRIIRTVSLSDLSVCTTATPELSTKAITRSVSLSDLSACV